MGSEPLQKTDIPTKKIKEFLELELLDTDFLLVTEEIVQIDEILNSTPLIRP